MLQVRQITFRLSLSKVIVGRQASNQLYGPPMGLLGQLEILRRETGTADERHLIGKGNNIICAGSSQEELRRPPHQSYPLHQDVGHLVRHNGFDGRSQIAVGI